MPKLQLGELMPDFTYTTPYEEGLTLSQTAAKAPKTALVFLRYYGCTVCQYDMDLYAKHFAELTAGGGQFLVVLQSDPSLVKEALEKRPLPYPIVCDPDQELYRAFSIEPAKSMAKMADLRMISKVAKARSAGFQHGAYEGNELQLPAAFVIDSDRKLCYVHYAKTGGDMPKVTELTQLLR